MVFLTRTSKANAARQKIQIRLDAKVSELAELHTLHAVTEADFAACDNDAEKREKYIASIIERRKKLETQLAAKNKQLASKDEELASKDEELASKDKELASKDKELAVNGKQVSDTIFVSVVAMKDLAELKRVYGTAQPELERTKHELVMARSEVDYLKAETAIMKPDHAALKEQFLTTVVGAWRLSMSTARALEGVDNILAEMMSIRVRNEEIKKEVMQKIDLELNGFR